MSIHNKYSHLTRDERMIIQTGCDNNSTKKAISLTLGKDNSTIGKEIKLHRHQVYKSSLPLECANYKKCKYGRNCSSSCPDFILFKCSRRDRSPGVCNGCPQFNSCRFNKYKYSADIAQKEYESSLVDSREGVNLTTDEAKKMGEIIKPLLEKGQSPYHIVTSHPELNICEKTLYNYIENHVFSIVGINNLDLRIKSKRKISKKQKTQYKKRKDRKYLKNRTYKDFEAFISEHPNASVVEMDTVYNDVTNGPFIQTFKFLDYGFTFAIYHESKTEKDMVDGLNQLYDILGHDLFIRNVEVLKTDRGSEFILAEELEMYDGIQRTHVFYCDPMASCQKGSLENNHREFRYILPKKTDLKSLGLTSQNALNTVVSHVNSAPKEQLKGKTPLEMMKFLDEDLYNQFIEYGICEIEKDKVILKPYLLKK